MKGSTSVGMPSEYFFILSFLYCPCSSLFSFTRTERDTAERIERCSLVRSNRARLARRRRAPAADRPPTPGSPAVEGRLPRRGHLRASGPPRGEAAARAEARLAVGSSSMRAACAAATKAVRWAASRTRQATCGSLRSEGFFTCSSHGVQHGHGVHAGHGGHEARKNIVAHTNRSERWT